MRRPLSFLLTSAVCLTLSAGFSPLTLDKAANTSRLDAQPADGKGGWLDLGSNDLHVLPAGSANYAGVTFDIPPAGDETTKNCLVLGRKGPETAVLELDTPLQSQRLYLLHAIADGPAPETHREIGKILLRYEDGQTESRAVCVGTDVMTWTSGKSFANAVRAWTDYNHNTQVSLFASQFKLNADGKLTQITFEANGTCPWMIVAATVGEKVRKLVPVRSSVEPTGSYKSPAPPVGLTRFPAGAKPKNVILIIGDGMGQHTARLASYYKHNREDGLYFQQLPVYGLCTTFSASSEVTDSAASGTALATGTKTSNGVLGLQVDDRHPRTNPVPLTSVAARAKAQGHPVAILTSDPLCGATPSAFFAHVLSRGQSEDICGFASTCGFDILVGNASTESWFRPKDKGGKRQDGRDLVSDMASRGYTLVHTAGEMAAAPREAKILGSLNSYGAEESIGEAVSAAIGRLADKQAGFFMMAECADTDHAGHSNDSSCAVKSASMVEYMTKAAVDFAQTRGDTLVLVTADHDTGHPVVLRSPGAKGRLLIQWSTTSHAKYPVPVYGYGPGAELFEGLLDNTDIAKNIAILMNLGE